MVTGGSDSVNPFQRYTDELRSKTLAPAHQMALDEKVLTASLDARMRDIQREKQKDIIKWDMMAFKIDLYGNAQFAAPGLTRE